MSEAWKRRIKGRPCANMVVGPYVTEQHYAKPATLETARACVNCGRLYDYEEPYCPYCYCRNPTYKGE